METLHTIQEMRQLQALPLQDKITLAQTRIVEWYEAFGGNVCISYSGGKDSTVLLHLVREIYPDTPAVYVDTRLDFPEIREHVKATANVIWIKPEMNFRDVIQQYGYCYPSKETANVIEKARAGTIWANQYIQGNNRDGTASIFKERYKRWQWLIDIPFKISDYCCKIMKERPLEKFQKEHGLFPYVGITNDESIRRQRAWLRTGCNSFKTNKSKPLSLWTEQNILRYIVNEGLTIPTVYGEIVDAETNSSMFIDELPNCKLKTTGETRTGCIFCPIAAHLEKPNKFQRLKVSHPELYRYCMTELKLDAFLTAVKVDH